MSLRRILFPLVFGGALLLSCDRVSEPPAINDPPARNSGNTVAPIGSLARATGEPSRLVRLEGQVVAVVPLVSSSAYLLKDSSGEIWVLDPSGTPPAVGKSVSLEGRLEVERVPDTQGDRLEVYVRQQQQL